MKIHGCGEEFANVPGPCMWILLFRGEQMLFAALLLQHPVNPHQPTVLYLGSFSSHTCFLNHSSLFLVLHVYRMHGNC